MEYTDNRPIVLIFIRTIGPVDPTYYAPTILQNLHKHVTLETFNEMDSNHHPVHMILTNVDVSYTTTSISRVDWYRYADRVASNIPDIPVLHTKEDINILVSKITAVICNAITKATTTLPLRTAKEANQTLKALIREKNRARRKYQITGDPVYRAVNNHLAKQVQELTKKTWNMKDGIVSSTYFQKTIKLSGKLRKCFENQTLKCLLSTPTGE